MTLRNMVGARLSDVFGMDNIIWVEGETDEECFPMIFRANECTALWHKDSQAWLIPGTFTIESMALRWRR